ncbi:CbbQ/NirQ/NorQ C-terminal domain-containing protein [Candidatus Woesearchaeota archaeon]|nr:CbbQ/NirQ/NorQ C-terminal domain-containing protein [Candidatus Woesearchaeota archaeon]
MIKIEFDEKDISKYVEQFKVQKKPFYHPVGNEVQIFENAKKNGQSVMLLGPTGSGKSRFVDFMAYQHGMPCITIPGYESVFIPGPLYIGAKIQAYTHLEEILEMNEDVLPLCHTLADWRRELHVGEIGEVIRPGKDFMFIVSMNPGAAYQKAARRFPKPSLAQRFVGIEFSYVRGEQGVDIIVNESGIDLKLARQLDMLAKTIDELHRSQEYAGSLKESIGYHSLIKAAQQIVSGTPSYEACHACISVVLSHDQTVIEAVDKLIKTNVRG